MRLSGNTMSHKQPVSRTAPSDPGQPDLVQPDRGQSATAIRLVDKAGFAPWLKTLTPAQRATIEAQRFEAEGYQHAIVPDGARVPGTHPQPIAADFRALGCQVADPLAVSMRECQVHWNGSMHVNPARPSDGAVPRLFQGFARR